MRLGLLGRVALGAALVVLASCGGDSGSSGVGGDFGEDTADVGSSGDAKTTTTAKAGVTTTAAKGMTGAKICAAISAADVGKALGDTVGAGEPADTNLTKSHFCHFTSTGGAAKGKVDLEITDAFPAEADWIAQMTKIGLTDSVTGVGDKAFYRKAATDGGRISVHKGALVYWVVVSKPGRPRTRSCRA